MTDRSTAVAVLLAEGADLDTVLTGLGEDQWDLPTPAPGWSIRDQVAHLTAAYRLAGVAAADPARYVALRAHERPGFNAFLTSATDQLVTEPPGRLIECWREDRRVAARALGALPPDRELPWMPTPMTAGVLAMAGVMEVFAHGQDIADALGVTPVRTDRIYWVVRLISVHWSLGYHAHGMSVPAEQPRIEVTAPSGAVWRFGPEDSAQRVVGDAVGLCLLATRRRHRDDVAVRAEGPVADRWLDVAQAYRGPAGDGRRPGQFPG